MKPTAPIPDLSTDVYRDERGLTVRAPREPPQPPWPHDLERIAAHVAAGIVDDSLATWDQADHFVAALLNRYKSTIWWACFKRGYFGDEPSALWKSAGDFEAYNAGRLASEICDAMREP